MAKPTELHSPIGRFVAAFVGFLTIIAAGVVFLTYEGNNHVAVNQKESSAASSTNTDKPGSLFYKRLGTSPIVNNEINVNKPNAKGPSDGFTLEIKVTETREEAEQLIDSLREKGMDAYYTPIAIRGRVQYRVRYGIYNDPKKAAADSKKITQAYDVKNKVIKL